MFNFTPPRAWAEEGSDGSSIADVAAMRFFCSLLAFMTLSAPFKVVAKTLIVTHGEVIYDDNRTTGAAIRSLLEDPSFDKKIVLISKGERNIQFNFSTEGLQFEQRESSIGEIEWDDSDRNLTLVGGFFDRCFSQTVFSIVLTSKKSLNFTVPLAAVYRADNVLRPNSSNLIQFEKEQGTDELKTILLEFLQHVNSQLKLWNDNYPKIKNRAEIVINLRGQLVERIGSGSRRIVFNFN